MGTPRPSPPPRGLSACRVCDLLGVPFSADMGESYWFDTVRGANASSPLSARRLVLPVARQDGQSEAPESTRHSQWHGNPRTSVTTPRTPCEGALCVSLSTDRCFASALALALRRRSNRRTSRQSPSGASSVRHHVVVEPPSRCRCPSMSGAVPVLFVVRYADGAIQFMSSSVAADVPFFLYMALEQPHAPNVRPSSLLCSSGSCNDSLSHSRGSSALRTFAALPHAASTATTCSASTVALDGSSTRSISSVTRDLTIICIAYY